MSIQPGNKDEDQANELSQLFDEIESGNEKHEETIVLKEDNEIDVLNLPPRKEIHTKNNRFRLKFSRPFIRFAFVIFIVALSICIALYIWQDEFTSLLHRL
ncbi:hypothetical protein M3210_01020 [Oceanobacillus luteolus]|uniref:hypothetical protein n=1 Tax=Oceanobacillus luteolus TaxID=1274358 RepID=UPI00203CF7EC|nr:hypothetical protein [Oceanobacillus luteolus]MCM3738837.1 hypothetical protein [Oceanobacillus luteolus]